MRRLILLSALLSCAAPMARPPPAVAWPQDLRDRLLSRCGSAGYPDGFCACVVREGERVSPDPAVEFTREDAVRINAACRPLLGEAI